MFNWIKAQREHDKQEKLESKEIIEKYGKGEV
jgi:hypothetical protein